MNINSFSVSAKGARLTVCLELTCDYIEGAVPKVKALFEEKEHNRRMPLPVTEVENNGLLCTVRCRYTYLLDYVFYGIKAGNTALSFKLFYGDMSADIFISPEKAELCRGVSFNEGDVVIEQSLMNKRTFLTLTELKNREVAKQVMYKPVSLAAEVLFRLYGLFNPVKKNRVAIMSGRRTSLGGNSEFVYNQLKRNNNIEIKFLFFEQKSGFSAIKNLFAFLKLYATSRVVIIDDYFRMLNLVKKRKGVKLVQLWHACGAFKTFGYTRLGKTGGALQISKSHRVYDYAIVSSKEVVPHYAEGFGISDKNVSPLGVARCDVFFDGEYKKTVREKLYSRYPALKDKKVVLFAPTFRGRGQQSAYYPEDKFDVNAFADSLGKEYALIVKLHPFCKEKPQIRKDLENRVFDLSGEDELNDLLFVTDLLITDYSSVVFEASLLDIPMLFYVFDLEEYIESRDFYYDFKSFIPGKEVRTQKELVSCILNSDFEQEKTEAFKNRFFDYKDGCSSQRAAELIESLLEVK